MKRFPDWSSDKKLGREGSTAYQKKRGANLKARLNSKVLSGLCQKQEQVFWWRGTPRSWEWYTGIQQSKRLNQRFRDHLPRNEGWNLRNESDGSRREQIQRQVLEKEPRRTAASKGWEEEKSQWKQERMKNSSEHRVTGICGWGASWREEFVSWVRYCRDRRGQPGLRKGHEIGQQCSPWWHSGEQFSCSRSASE